MPLIIFIIFLMYFFKDHNYRVKAIRNIRKKGIKGILLFYIAKVFTPKKNGKIYKKYRDLLQFTKWEVESFFLLKLSLLLILMIMIVLIKTTNINIYSQKIFSSYDYKVDMIYEFVTDDIDKGKALETEIILLRDILAKVSKEDINRLPKEDLQQMIISTLAKKELKILTDPQNIANKVYYRLIDYYAIKEFKFILAIPFLIIVYFSPELIVSIHNLLVKSNAAAELVFLKKLIILNGSIKPTSYNEVLDIIADKSKYYKHILKKIMVLRQKNTIDNKKIYKEKYLGTINNLNLKLFLEKLDQADNYDYDHAIKNIENEFRTDKRERARKIKERIETMEIVGIIGSMFIITLITIYLLLPWLSSYNLNSIL